MLSDMQLSNVEDCFGGGDSRYPEAVYKHPGERQQKHYVLVCNHAAEVNREGIERVKEFWQQTSSVLACNFGVLICVRSQFPQNDAIE